MEYKDEQTKFEEEIKRRNITKLVHFTKADNLYIIVGHKKIISRITVEEKAKLAKHQNVEHLFNVRDRSRLDGKKDCICLSIEHPNYWLFNKKRQDEKGIWCVITIKPHYLFLKDTLFYFQNAASNFSKSQSQADKFEHFLNLYKDPPTQRSFDKPRPNDLKPCYPTDIQAEVLVKDNIIIDDFINIGFNNEDDLEKVKTQLKEYAKMRPNYKPELAISKLIVKSGFWTIDRN